MAERHLNARYGDDLVDHHTFVIAGDGCLMEGVSHEAISLAGRLKLNKLIVMWDDNNVTIDGVATIAERGDQKARFAAAGWAVRAVNGHDHADIADALRWAKTQTQPVFLACKTVISRGAGPKEGDPHSHGYTLFDDQIQAARAAMGWTAAPFETPAVLKQAWEAAAHERAQPRAAWEARLQAHPKADDFQRAMSGDLPADAFAALDLHIQKALETRPADATRSASGAALAQLTPYIEEMVGGSADLTGSNNTLVKGMVDFDLPDYAGRYVHYGVREFGMSAAMNGLALHGGVIPYSGAFFVFSDYSRPAIRLGALMGVRTINVLTHDSIGVGEDGPTHQPVEHLAAFRAMPNLLTFRPADQVETAECWKLALQSTATPSLMVLSRQKVPAIRTAGVDLSAKGAYELNPASGPAQVSIFASGTEVSIAVAAQKALEAEGIATRVVSTPCWTLFDRQSAAYQAEVIGSSPVNVAVEAAVRLGWDRFIGRDGVFVGMHGFGASAPAERLYQEFGITAESVVEQAKQALARN